MHCSTIANIIAIAIMLYACTYRVSKYSNPHLYKLIGTCMDVFRQLKSSDISEAHAFIYRTPFTYFNKTYPLKIS